MKRQAKYIAISVLTLLAVVAPLAAQDSVTIVNAASFEVGRPLAPGCWATAFADFGSVGVVETVADSVPFPTTLGGVQVLINGVASPMNYAGPAQLNFLLPGATAVGRATVQVTVSGMVTYEGSLQIWDVSPGLLSINPGDALKPGAVLNSDFTLNSEANPAQPGEVIQIYGVGADFAELPADGAPAPTDRLISTFTPTRAYISVAEATVQFSGLAPGLVNAWQLNLIVPSESYISGAVPVFAEVGGLTTNPISVWVAQ